MPNIALKPMSITPVCLAFPTLPRDGCPKWNLHFPNRNRLAGRSATASFMRILPFILLVVLTGCGRPESHAQKMGKQISQWVPDGTSLALARQTMEQHQFACSVTSYSNAAQMSNDPDAVLWKTIVTRGRQHFPVTNISHLECKTPQCHVTFTIINDEVSGYSAFGSL